MPGYPWRVHVDEPVLVIEISTRMLPAAPPDPATSTWSCPTGHRATVGLPDGEFDGEGDGVWAGGEAGD
jgi:hypothetical protein